MTLEQAIELLRKEYERAKNMEYVKKPLAWALFQVWKQVDSMKVEKQREYNRTAQQKSRAKRKAEAKMKGGAEE